VSVVNGHFWHSKEAPVSLNAKSHCAESTIRPHSIDKAAKNNNRNWNMNDRSHPRYSDQGDPWDRQSERETLGPPFKSFEAK
jgi:hypothetical protein